MQKQGGKSLHPKMEHIMARKGRHIQKWKNSAQEGVGISKNRAGRDKMESMHPKIGQFRARRCQHIQIRNDLGPERVHASKRWTHDIIKGLACPKRGKTGRKGSVCPNSRPEGVHASKRGTHDGMKGSACPKM